jgi:hypothetical protein
VSVQAAQRLPFTGAWLIDDSGRGVGNPEAIQNGYPEWWDTQLDAFGILPCFQQHA